MRSIRGALLVGATAMVAACHHGDDDSSGEVTQRYRDSVQAICDSPSHVPDDGQPAMVRLTELTTWLDRHVSDPSMRRLGQGLDQGNEKETLAAAVKRAGLPKCQLLDNDMALQSFHDAMQIFCDAPRKVSNRDEAQRYLGSHLLNPQAVKMFASLGNVDPSFRADKLRQAAAKAGVTSCPMVDQLASHPTPTPATLPTPKPAGAP